MHIIDPTPHYLLADQATIQVNFEPLGEPQAHKPPRELSVDPPSVNGDLPEPEEEPPLPTDTGLAPQDGYGFVAKWVKKYTYDYVLDFDVPGMAKPLQIKRRGGPQVTLYPPRFPYAHVHDVTQIAAVIKAYNAVPYIKDKYNSSTGMTPNRVMLVNFPPKPKRGKAKKT